MDFTRFLAIRSLGTGFECPLVVWATGSNVSRYDVDEKRKNSETEFIDKIARPSLVGFRQELVSGLEYH